MLISVNCHVFQHMLNNTPLKSSKKFMTAKGIDGEKEEIITIHRSSGFFQLNQFRSIRHDQIWELLDLSMDDNGEEKKFSRFIYPDQWPPEMKHLHGNLIKSTLLDDDLQKNREKRRNFPSFGWIVQAPLPVVYLWEKHKIQSWNWDRSSCHCCKRYWKWGGFVTNWD